MNQIAVKQMEPRMIDLLRARTLIYKRAKNYQAIALMVTLIFPVLGGITAAYAPALRPFVAFFALLFGFVDVVLLDRWHKARLRTAAKLQEDFDCTVLNMEWNKFLVGAKVDPEEVFEDACKKLSDSDEQRLLNWYPLAVQALPLHLARLVCQRTNLWYDSKLRQIYCWVLIGGLVVLAAIAGIVSLSIDFTMTSFVMTVLAPMTPVVTWILRECNRQTDTVTLLDRLKGEVEKLWETSLSGVSEQSVGARSRELQDAIYNHRVSSPLIFDWIYSLNRNSLEARMNVGADHWIREVTEFNSR